MTSSRTRFFDTDKGAFADSGEDVGEQRVHELLVVARVAHDLARAIAVVRVLLAPVDVHRVRPVAKRVVVLAELRLESPLAIAPAQLDAHPADLATRRFPRSVAHVTLEHDRVHGVPRAEEPHAALSVRCEDVDEQEVRGRVGLGWRRERNET